MDELSLLLEKIRTLSQLVERRSDRPTDFNDLARNLAQLTESNVYIVNAKGSFLGTCLLPGLPEVTAGEETPAEKPAKTEYVQWLLSISETVVGTKVAGDALLTVIPVFSGPIRLGTVVLVKKQPFTTQEVILAEVGATVIGLELFRHLSEEAEKVSRKKEAVSQALAVLSYSEIEAVKYIFSELEGDEGFVVAIRLADKYMLTRSVIVNALRKLESAGIIQARSLGMKGTYIKVLNEYLHDQLAKMG